MISECSEFNEMGAGVGKKAMRKRTPTGAKMLPEASPRHKNTLQGTKNHEKHTNRKKKDTSGHEKAARSVAPRARRDTQGPQTRPVRAPHDPQHPETPQSQDSGDLSSTPKVDFVR